MSFGLKNTGATYEILVNKMFKKQIGKTMEIYIDEMVVKYQKLRTVFKILKKHSISWISST